MNYESAVNELQLFVYVLQLLVYELLKNLETNRNNDRNERITFRQRTYAYPRLLSVRSSGTFLKKCLTNRNGVLCLRRLVETETKQSFPSTNITGTTAAVAAAAALTGLNHHHSPSDPVVASVLHSRQNPRPGRLLLENVNNRPQTMDRGTQANTDDSALVEAVVEAMPPPSPPSTSHDSTSSELVSSSPKITQFLRLF